MVLSLFSCAPGKTLYTESYVSYFDTYCEIKLYTQDPKEFDRFRVLIEDELAICHQLFDIYQEYDGEVNLCTVNRIAGAAPVAVDDRIFELLSRSKQLYQLTQGKTNIALGAVLSIWHTYREEGVAVPTEDTLRRAYEHTDIEDLILNAEKKTVFYSDPKLQLDVGAVAKGYVTDRICRMLLDAGFLDFNLNIGGSIYCAGHKPDGGSWRIGVEAPEAPATIAAVVDCVDHGLTVSGDYQRYYEVDGVRYCHIIDPDTLYPAEYAASVTVYSADAFLADALSTALFCMNYEDGVALLKQLDGCEAMWILKDGTTLQSSGFPN